MVDRSEKKDAYAYGQNLGKRLDTAKEGNAEVQVDISVSGHKYYKTSGSKDRIEEQLARGCRY